MQEDLGRHAPPDEPAKLLKGWFKDTWPNAPIERIALPRLHGDMHVSTGDALLAPGHKISPGGFIIVDDFGAVEGCRGAIDDDRRDRSIQSPVHDSDGIGVPWRVAA